jgi:hypothetical protein
MHQELLMHVASAHIQDQLRGADQRRQVKEARSNAKAGVASRRRVLRWQLRRFPAQPVSPAR